MTDETRFVRRDPFDLAAPEEEVAGEQVVGIMLLHTCARCRTRLEGRFLGERHERATRRLDAALIRAIG